MAAVKGFVRTHWGLYEAEGDGGALTSVRPFGDDPDPSDIGRSLADALDHPTRVRRPAVRRGWLENGPGATSNRGREDVVEVGWEEVLDRLAAELNRVRTTFGNGAIFGGSYGWASAGRFHHAQSQVHRFLNCIGGYCGHKHSYSCGAAHVIMPHVLGYGFGEILDRHSPSWPVIARHSELVVMFGGVSTKNAQVAPGGSGRHELRLWLERCRAAGARFVNVSPQRSDAWEGLGVADLQDALPLDVRRRSLMSHAVRPVTPGKTFVGQAVTVYSTPGDNLMTHCGLYVAEPGDVLVVSNGGVPVGALWGENACTDALTRGLAGIVVDGPTRDTAALRRMEAPVWTTIVSVSSPDKIGTGAVNVPVACAGVTANPGDTVVGDDDGVVAFAAHHVPELVRAVRARMEREDRARERIGNGERIFEVAGIRTYTDRAGVVWLDEEWFPAAAALDR